MQLLSKQEVDRVTEHLRKIADYAPETLMGARKYARAALSGDVRGA